MNEFHIKLNILFKIFQCYICQILTRNLLIMIKINYSIYMQHKTKYNSFLFILIQLLYNQNEIYSSLLLYYYTSKCATI